MDDRPLFFAQNPDPMWIYDLDSLRFLEVNRAAVETYGYSRDEFLAMTIGDIRPPEDLPALIENLANVTGGLDEAGLWRHRLKDGSLIHVEIRSHTLPYEGREAELVVARDVTRLVALERERSELLRREQLARQEAEAATRRLEEASQLLRMAGKRARLGGWRWQVGDDRLVWSEETAAIHELPPGQTPSAAEAIRFYVPEHRPRIRRAFAACVASGTPYDEQLQIETAKGKRRWVRAIGEAERGADGKVVAVHGAFQDVTELVETRERSERAARRLRETLESMGDGFLVLDRAWTFTFVNGEAARLVQRTREELLGRNVWEVFPEAAGTAFQRNYERALERQEKVSFREHFPPLDAWFEVNAYPTTDGLAVYFRDVTGRKRAEEALAISEERFRLVAAATNDVVWDWDLSDGSVWWNDNLKPVFGYEPETMTSSRSWTERIHPQDRQRVVEAIRRTVEGDEVNLHAEYRYLRADGSAAHVIDRGFVIRNEAGNAVRMIGSILDVTQRRELDERLGQTQKLESVGQLTGGIAHDFNNLLTVIMGSVEQLAGGLTGDGELLPLAETTLSAAQRGAELTQRLLAFARRQALEPKVVDANRLIASMEGLLRRTLRENIDIAVTGAPDLRPALVDPGQLEVAILNLAINARDAMPDGGLLSIGTANLDLTDDEARSGGEEMPPGAYVRIFVSDSGSGMAAEVAARAFEPFFTTKKVGKGSGLGLSMVYGFVKQSRGHARIDSAPEEGTTISLCLPCAPADAGELLHAPETRQEAGGSEHVLVVEDDELVRAHVAAQLQSLGYRVSTANNGSEALAVLEGLDHVDLLFTDVVMPGGMNGGQLAEAARKRCPGLKVLFTSGYPENAIVHEGRLDPDVQLISKPYRRNDLAAKLRKVLSP